MKNYQSLVDIEEDIFLSNEWLLLAYAIMRDDILEYIYQKYKDGQIKQKHFSGEFRIIFSILIKYWKKFNRSPKLTTGALFSKEAEYLSPEKMEIVGSYLERLDYEFATAGEHDSDYIKTVIIPQFVQKKEYERIAEETKQALTRNDLTEADKILNSITVISDSETENGNDLGVAIPGSIKTAQDYYAKDKDKDSMFQIKGAIGRFIGPIYRGKLYALTGIEKAGKSFIAENFGRYGVRYHGLKCLDINLEMSVEDKNERHWQKEFKFGIDKAHSGKMLVPIFDCENNQTGSCLVLQHKINKKDLWTARDEIVAFNERRDWKICTKCRQDTKIRKNASYNKKFVPAIWYKEYFTKLMTERKLTRAIKAAAPYKPNNYRIKCFAQRSKTIDEIIEFIYQYSERAKWKPDILIIDYLDICRSVHGKLMDRGNVDYNWQTAAGLATELNCAMFVPDQAVKAERGKRSLSNMCTSESKTKDAHLDMRLSLNTTSVEQELGLQRLGMLFRRKGKLSHAEVMLLQRRETGEMMLDSEFWFSKDTHYPTVKERKGG